MCQRKGVIERGGLSNAHFTYSYSSDDNSTSSQLNVICGSQSKCSTNIIICSLMPLSFYFFSSKWILHFCNGSVRHLVSRWHFHFFLSGASMIVTFKNDVSIKQQSHNQHTLSAFKKVIILHPRLNKSVDWINQDTTRKPQNKNLIDFQYGVFLTTTTQHLQSPKKKAPGG